MELQVADFIESYQSGKPAHPTFKDAPETQIICDTVLKAAKSGCMEQVPQA